jgi:hypothetical protein
MSERGAMQTASGSPKPFPRKERRHCFNREPMPRWNQRIFKA